MDKAIDILNMQVLPHWPFIAWFVIAMLVGQVMVKSIFTKKHAETLKPKWLWHWARKTLPLHPVFTGVVIGLLWRNPEAGVSGALPAATYFAVSGALSVWLYETIKRRAEKHGVDLTLPGQTKPPA